MFKAHIGICSCGCGKKGIVCVKAGLIQKCNYEKKQKDKKDRGKIKSKPVRKPTGEAAFFQAIWAVREHKCFDCGEPLGDDQQPIFFSHVLSKGAFPAFRLLDRNIVLQLPDCHREWETGDRGKEKFKKMRELYEELKEEYHKKGAHK